MCDYDGVRYLNLFNGCRWPPWPLTCALVLAAAATTTLASPLRENLPDVPDAKVHSGKLSMESGNSEGSPLNVQPFHYDLYIQPSLEEGTFTGFVDISFNASENVTFVNLVFIESILQGWPAC